MSITTSFAATQEPKTAEADQAPKLHIAIVTGDHLVYDGVGDRVVVPAANGEISILVHHAPLLAALEPGVLLVREGQREESFAIGGGFIEVRDDQVIVLADTAESAEEIDVARAEAARRRASMLVRAQRGQPGATEAQLALRRSRARLRAVRNQGLHRRSR